MAEEVKVDDAKQPEELKLTDREIAIARGENPDSPAEVTNTEASAETSSTDAAAKEGTEEQPGKDAGAINAQDGSGKEAASSTDSPSWLKAEHKDLAASYGLSDEDLKDFGSVEEFQRATKILTKQFANIGQQIRQPQTQPTTEQTPVAPKAEEPKQPAGKKKPERIDLEKLKAEGFDEETINFATKHNDAVDYLEEQAKSQEVMQQQFGQVTNYLAQVEHTRRWNAFHDAVDGLDDKRFGKSVSDNGQFSPLTKEADTARAKLAESLDQIILGIQAKAHAEKRQAALPPMKVLLSQARQLAFSEDIRAEERKKLTQQITEQSKRRRPAAGNRDNVGRYAQPKKEPLTPNEAAKEVAENPTIAKWWKENVEAAA